MARQEEPAVRVLVLVCIECGKEYMFEDEEPGGELVCEKCGNEVFRSFYDSADRSEEEEDFAETTGRDVALDAGATEVTRSDLLDLNNL